MSMTPEQRGELVLVSDQLHDLARGIRNPVEARSVRLLADAASSIAKEPLGWLTVTNKLER